MRVEGAGPSSLDLETGAIVAMEALATCGRSDATKVFDVGLATNLNFDTCSMSIADVGPVAGLGEVDTWPTAGIVQSLSAIVGHGYALKTSEGHLYRIYVDAEVVGTSGGVIGETIKWAPFPASTITASPASISFHLCSGTVAPATIEISSSVVGFAWSATVSSRSGGYSVTATPTSGSSASTIMVTPTASPLCPFPDQETKFFDDILITSPGLQVPTAVPIVYMP